MDKSLEDVEQRVLVGAEDAHRHFGRAAERALDAGDAHAVDDVVREAEWHLFRHLEGQALIG